MPFLILCILSLLCIPLNAGPSHQRADDHAPISVMGDHTHNVGEWMMSYRFMPMNMSQLSNGNRDLSPSEVISEGGYTMAPTDMNMTMHMFGAMFAINDQITLGLMVPYLENAMKSSSGMMEMKTDSSGLGDISITGLIRHIHKDHEKSHFILGLSVPTGAIDETNDNDATLGYGMQLGSGTYDIKTGYTWTKQHQTYSIGAQLTALFRTDRNSKGYRLGNKGSASFWLAKPWNQALSSSLKLNYQTVGQVKGSHKDITIMQVGMNPVLNPSNSGHQIVTAGIGTNLLLSHGLRLAAEYIMPLMQHQDGYQLETKNYLVLGLQKTL